jgi:hypothetical protein
MSNKSTMTFGCKFKSEGNALKKQGRSLLDDYSRENKLRNHGRSSREPATTVKKQDPQETGVASKTKSKVATKEAGGGDRSGPSQAMLPLQKAGHLAKCPTEE